MFHRWHHDQVIVQSTKTHNSANDAKLPSKKEDYFDNFSEGNCKIRRGIQHIYIFVNLFVIEKFIQQCNSSKRAQKSYWHCTEVGTQLD